MCVAATTVLVTPEEYLTQEELAEEKSEYEDGVIIPMPGGTPQHSQIKVNVITLLTLGIYERTGFVVYNSDVKVRTPDATRYTYPDAIVVAGKSVFDVGAEGAILTNPCLLVEVLSKSTQERDRGAKFAGYKLIPSMREYLLIDQYTVHLTQWVLDADQTWRSTEYTNLDDVVQLVSVPVQLPLQRVYWQVAFG